MPTTIEARSDLVEMRAKLEQLVGSIEIPDDTAGRTQLHTLTVLLDGVYELLKHAEAIAGIPGASLTWQELSLVRVMIGELNSEEVGADDLRYAVDMLMRPPRREGA
jgi:hypothetical protein